MRGSNCREFYIGNFSRQEILAKMKQGRCVKFSLSPIYAI